MSDEYLHSVPKPEGLLFATSTTSSFHHHHSSSSSSGSQSGGSSIKEKEENEDEGGEGLGEGGEGGKGGGGGGRGVSRRKEKKYMRKEPAGGHLKDGAPRMRAPKGLTCLHCHNSKVRRERGKERGRERTHAPPE